ncbi:hypothetical protein [Methylobacterium platani]|uniref:Uncharacterized protein n=2 Tax=Methylobacterium platani TaxID=427683 RepID=A0A179SCB0_9HYPH|nr:hypothetical protein [Methylobacterium platani]KMO17810.1 hypothetical protein SQ03_11760 [Methylobacterium platani JCM 14648]OAS25450.1 hypothetical protein A5481_08765 [Methylobacterium platani]
MVELVPMAEAAGFTAGCFVLHAARASAEVLTPILAYLVFALAVCLLIVAGIQHASDPDQLVAMMTQAMATY